MTEGHKIIMKLEILILSWVIPEKHSYKAASAYGSPIQEEAAGGVQGGPQGLHEQAASSSTTNPGPPDELPEPPVHGPCREQLSAEQLGCLVYRWQFREERTVSFGKLP